MGANFVTGASSGIGRSLARRLARRGEAVALVARRKPLLDSLAEEINQSGGRAAAIECDVTDRLQVREAVAAAETALGSIDRLVACAGGGERTFVDSFTAAHIEQTWALNVGGTANCIEALLPAMLARGSGHLVAVSSLAAYRGLPQAAAYSSAKAALSNLMESLRIDLAPRGIATTLLCPGFVHRPPIDQKTQASRARAGGRHRADVPRDPGAPALLRFPQAARPRRHLGTQPAGRGVRQAPGGERRSQGGFLSDHLGQTFAEIPKNPG